MADESELARILRENYGGGFQSGLSGNAMTGRPSSVHMQNAHAMLQLSPQEQSLYQRHLTNLYGSGGVDHPDGSRSSLYQAVVGNGGRYYSIPTVWDGRILPVNDAMRRVDAEGWHNFPSYASPEEADARYAQLHNFMERDTQDYFNSLSPFAFYGGRDFDFSR